MPRAKGNSVNWLSARFVFVNGTDTYPMIAKQFNATADAVAQRAKREGWVTERNKIQREAVAKAADLLADAKDGAILKYSHADLDISDKLRDACIRLLNRQRLKPSELRSVAGAAESAQRIARLALGLTTGNTGLSGNPKHPISLVDLAKLSTEQLIAVLADQETFGDDTAGDPGGTGTAADG